MRSAPCFWLIAALATSACAGKSETTPSLGATGTTSSTGSSSAAMGTGGAGSGGSEVKDASGGGSTDDDADPDDDAFVSCMADPRVDHYTTNLTKRGTQGALSFVLLSSDPAPPQFGINVFALKVLHDDGTPLTGELKPDLAMIDHHHAISVKPAVTFDQATVTYTADPVYLFMAGVWKVSFTAYAAAATDGPALDTGEFYFCIDEM